MLQAGQTVFLVDESQPWKALDPVIRKEHWLTSGNEWSSHMYMYPVQNEPQMLNFQTVSVFLNVQMSVTFKGNREKFSCKHF